ncbi:MAG: hypothetical protein WBB64_00645, partial [Anaerolineales bacterium]
VETKGLSLSVSLPQTLKLNSIPSSPFQLEGSWGVGAAPDGTYPLSPFLKERGISLSPRHLS